MKQLPTLLILASLLLAACASKPTPDLEATVRSAIEATKTAQPTNTPKPTHTPKPSATPTSANTPIGSTAESIAALFIAVSCVARPLFFCVSIVLVLVHRKHKQKTKAEKAALAQWAKEVELSLRNEMATLEEQVQQLKQDALQASRDEWFESIANEDYRNEIEVEVKFVHPLVRFLGYDNNFYQIRVPVGVQVGRQETKGQADWVIWSGAPTQRQSQALIVIEAKEPNQELDKAAQKQARSYAFGLNAPKYVVTNGRRLQVFLRGIQDDTCVVDCTVNDMSDLWPQIEQVIGANACLDIKQAGL